VLLQRNSSVPRCFASSGRQRDRQPGRRCGLAIALAHGVGLAVVVTIMLPISGGHINPAVSFALWLGKQIDA